MAAAYRHFFRTGSFSSSSPETSLNHHNKHDGGGGRRTKPRNRQTGIFSGCSLPFVSRGRRRSALSFPGQRAEERRHQQTAHGVRQHVVCEVERRRSSDPPSVCQLVSGSSVARHGDHGDVWSPSFPVKPDRSHV